MARKKKRAIETVVNDFVESVAERLLDHIDRSMEITLELGQGRAAQHVDPYIEACKVVGVHPKDSLKIAEAVYKTKAKFAHPDAGGSRAAFQRLQKAMGIIRKRKKEG